MATTAPRRHLPAPPPLREPPARERLACRIEQLAAPERMTQTLAPALTIYAWSVATRHMHLVYRPSLCVVVRGEKRALVGDRMLAYDPERYFFTAVPLPAELRVDRRAAAPLVGLVLELDIETVARIALEIDDVLRASPSPVPPASVAFTGHLTARLVDALDRLVLASSDPLRHAVLYPVTLREVVFELLVGPEGPALRQAVADHGKLRAIIDAVRHIDANLREPIRVATLARRAGMSESSFFSRFRATIGTTPLQYLKTLRLTMARVLLEAGAESITEVALQVGYGSHSQLSRDFRRAFGHAPSEVASRRRAVEVHVRAGRTAKAR